jgi:hypothetical protein
VGDWLLRQPSILRFPAQNWMLLALAIVLVSVVAAWWFYERK